MTDRSWAITPAISLVNSSTSMKTGTESITDAIAGSPATMRAASTTTFPVMWAVNSPFRPRKPIMSVDPAMTLSRTGSVRAT